MIKVSDVIPLSEFKLCNCGEGKWQVTNIEIDDKVEERIRTFVEQKYRKRFLKELEEGKISRKIYILHRKCSICDFVPPPALIPERLLKYSKEELRVMWKR